MADQNKPMSNADLVAEVQRLQAALQTERTARTAAEETAMAMAQAGPYTGGSEEQPTGKTVKVKKCVNPWVQLKKGDDPKDFYKFVEVDMPTYFYRLDLPAGALNLSTNGVEYYHGHTYEFTYDTLVDMKSRVARCWDHEKSIHGENENAYKKPTAQHLLGQGVRQPGVH